MNFLISRRILRKVLPRRPGNAIHGVLRLNFSLPASAMLLVSAMSGASHISVSKTEAVSRYEYTYDII